MLNTSISLDIIICGFLSSSIAYYVVIFIVVYANKNK